MLYHATDETIFKQALYGRDEARASGAQYDVYITMTHSCLGDGLIYRLGDTLQRFSNQSLELVAT
jgi:hypothetical protein